MKQLTKILYFNVALFILVGCVGNTNGESTTDSSENTSVLETKEEDTTETVESTSTSESEEPYTDDENDISSEETVKNDSNNVSKVVDTKEEETLSQYSSEQIEYARVWLQLGPNQELDELNVRYISAGEPLNPNDDTSANYPEDVIQLAGSRLVDGSVTYSGNGDGTINLYNVPLRWDGRYPAGENFYTEIIENTKVVSIDPGDDEEIIALINLLNVH